MQAVALSGNDNFVSVSVTPTLTVGATYVTNDYCGTSASPMTFAGMARRVGGGGYIRSVFLVDRTGNTGANGAMDLWIFNATVTPPADSAAWALSDADAAKAVAWVSIPAAAFSTPGITTPNNVAAVGGLALRYKCAAADTALYVCMILRGTTPAYVNGDITLTINAELD